MAFLGSLVTILLGNPAIRGFLEEVAVRVFAELWHRGDTDPVFRARFSAAASELVQAQTVEEKQLALKKIQAIRSGAPTA